MVLNYAHTRNDKHRRKGEEYAFFARMRARLSSRECVSAVISLLDYGKCILTRDDRLSVLAQLTEFPAEMQGLDYRKSEHAVPLNDNNCTETSVTFLLLNFEVFIM